jgi:hypothetical protein
MIKNIPDINRNIRDVFNFKQNKLTSISGNFADILLNMLASGNKYYLHTCSDRSHIGITKGVQGEIVLYYKSEAMFYEFMNMLENKTVDDSLLMCKKDLVVTKDKPKQLYIYDYSSQSRNLLYNDRTFDRIVSKHKKIIKQHLDDLLLALNEEKSVFNGYGSYNFGLILYGEPGTGKTSFIKAICNYLGRTMYTINMTDVKTNDNFRNLFTDRNSNSDPDYVKKYVYAIDEIDCVPGFLSRTKNENKNDDESNPKSTIYKLRERYSELVKAKCKAGKENSELIEKEIENIKKET